MTSPAAETIADLLARGHAVRFTVSGESMDPLVRCGDALLVEPARVERIRCGDVVLAALSRGLTAHRVVRIETTPQGLQFVTRGDRLPGDDRPFGAAELLGRVVQVERDGRRFAVARATGLVLQLRRFAARVTRRMARR